MSGIFESHFSGGQAVIILHSLGTEKGDIETDTRRQLECRSVF